MQGDGAERVPNEICTSVDIHNNVIGCISRAQLRSDNCLHRATYIYVHNPSKTQLLVQRRTSTKDYCPNMLDPCFGGVVAYPESYEQNAIRELREEIGLPSTSLVRSGITELYEDESTRVFGDVWTAEFTGDIGSMTLQAEEVASVSWMNIDDVLCGNPNRQPDGFTPDAVFFLRLLVDRSKMFGIAI